METGETTQQAADLEGIYLSRLEAEYQQLLASYSQNVRQQTPEDISAFLQHLQAWDQYLRTYEPLAQYLMAAGRPQLSFRLSQIRNDLQGAIRIYSQMYQSALDFRNRCFQIQTDTDREWTRTILETNIRNQQVFDRCQQMHSLVLYRDYPMWVADLVTKLGG